MTDEEQAALDSLKQVLSSDAGKNLEEDVKDEVAKGVEEVGKQVAEDAVEETKEDVLKKVQEILAAHDGQESNIGHRHEYWSLMNKYRAMLRGHA